MRYLPTAAIAASLLGGSIGYFTSDSLPELPTCTVASLPNPSGPCAWQFEDQTVVTTLSGDHRSIVYVVDDSSPRMVLISACFEEDGSGQDICRWQAGSAGNGEGQSFTYVDGFYVYDDDHIEN